MRKKIYIYLLVFICLLLTSCHNNNASTTEESNPTTSQTLPTTTSPTIPNTTLPNVSTSQLPTTTQIKNQEYNVQCWDNKSFYDFGISLYFSGDSKRNNDNGYYTLECGLKFTNKLDHNMSITLTDIKTINVTTNKEIGAPKLNLSGYSIENPESILLETTKTIYFRFSHSFKDDFSSRNRFMFSYTITDTLTNNKYFCKSRFYEKEYDYEVEKLSLDISNPAKTSTGYEFIMNGEISQNDYYANIDTTISLTNNNKEFKFFSETSDIYVKSDNYNISYSRADFYKNDEYCHSDVRDKINIGVGDVLSILISGEIYRYDYDLPFYQIIYIYDSTNELCYEIYVTFNITSENK